MRESAGSHPTEWGRSIHCLKFPKLPKYQWGLGGLWEHTAPGRGRVIQNVRPTQPTNMKTTREKHLEKTLKLFLQFMDSLPRGWLGKTTGDIGALNEAFIEARKLGLLKPTQRK